MWNAETLRERLQRPRDTRRAWARFAPQLTYGRHWSPAPHDARRAAVLTLLYLDEGVWRIPLIERPSLGIHASQVSFPGGQIEPGESPEEAALREFEEELGTRPLGIELCGQLTAAYVFASNFWVIPCVGLVEHRLPFVPNLLEVANLLEPSLVQLSDPATHGRHTVQRRGLEFQAPHIEFAGRLIWGATSLMLSELLTVLGPELESATPTEERPEDR